MNYFSKKILFCLFIFFFNLNLAYSENLNVIYAGFSFSGNYIDKDIGIKYTENIIKNSDEPFNVISKSLLNEIKQTNPKYFNLSFDYADLNQGNSEAIVMAVTLDNEYYFSEYEPLTKTYINNIQMFFTIMFYNFNTKTLIASIPYDVTMPFLTKEKVSNSQITNEIKKFYTVGLKSADDGSIINAFTQVKKILNEYQLKDKYKFRIGVRSITIEDKAISSIPVVFQNNQNTFKNILAQSFAGRLSTHNDVALVPFTEGMAIGGAMKQQFVNSNEIYDIKLPKPEFVIDLTLRGYKKKLAKSSDVENLYWWASFINITILQPDLNKVYFNENLKNLLKKKIPAQIKDIDDWYKFYMSTIQLFDKFALNVSSPDQKWTSKTSKNTELYENLEELQPLLDKLR
tara:strand:+ start:3361 stop:4563 length:1203 start_codon:yes stop_codon:yes gene_type:complete